MPDSGCVKRTSGTVKEACEFWLAETREFGKLGDKPRVTTVPFSKVKKSGTLRRANSGKT